VPEKMDFETNLLGQVFIFGFEGSSPSEDFIKLLKKWNLAGVILFSENIESTSQIKESILESSSDVPPFIMIDQEGGSKNRITRDFPTFPPNKYYGEREDQKGLYEAYRTTARSLAGLGINVNLAPVVDVLTNPLNKVIGERAFGNDPEKVSVFSSVAIDAIHAGGILACAKHFPGIGDIEVDPHHKMPDNKNSRERFKQIDFPPFKAAIRSEVDFIMTAHVKCLNLDTKNPASLSPMVCTETLKMDLGYNGLVLTDDMGMGAIKENFDILDACEKAYLAGNDLILLSHEYEEQPQILESFSKLLKDRKIKKDKISNSIDRILLKKKKALM
jgi:beta-N-acetylhexosaminidase